MIPVIYDSLCPVCGGDLSAEEIESGTCSRKNRALGDFPLRRRAEEFEEFFRDATGFEMRALQRMWARRVLAGYSFAAIAPTGIGKTLFDAVMAAFLEREGKRSYIIVPTTLLLKEVSERLSAMDADFVAYHGSMKKGEKEEAKGRIEGGDFGILLTTTAFLSRNFSLLRGKKLNFIFVDDVDSLLKTSRNLEKVISLLHRNGVLMVSTATGTRGYNTKILREKLNFDVGNVRNAARNVLDVKASKRMLGDIVERMGPGGLIFVSRSDEIGEVLRFLTGERTGVVTAESKEAFDKFQSGELDFLVGVSSPYGALVRGIDMPERIRYAVFYGIPHFRVSLENPEKLKDRTVLGIAYSLLSEFPELRGLIDKKDIDALREWLSEISTKNIATENMVIEDGHAIIPDVKTYIQASGRTSRLYSGGITRGASFLLDEKHRIAIFEKRARIYDIDFVDIGDVNFPALIREIDEDRRRIRERREAKEVIEPILFIVESPNKARHIAHFFGKPNIRVIENAVVYEVSTGTNVLLIAPSLGHVTDLSTTRGYHGVLVDGFVPIYASIKKCRSCGYQFVDGGEKCPICGSPDIYDAARQISLLRKLAFETGKVLIGTDPDTEGEKIAWDLYNLLSPFASEIHRAEFHEVTPKAIMKAISSSRDMNENLVKAQMVRRIEDRWIGFEFSHILQRKFRRSNLSAGRAQTPVLGWVIARFDESRKRKKAWFIKGTNVQVPWRSDVKVLSELLREEERERTVPPYTTDTILRDASAILHLGSREAMRILQDLFEKGLITYHRTDSTHVSDAGLNVARMYLRDDFVPRRWGAEGAHECIRPTRPLSADDLRLYLKEGALRYDLSDESLRVYDLIFRRFMASQTYWREKVRTYRFSKDGSDVECECVVEAKGRGYELYPYATKIQEDPGEGEIILQVEERIISPRPYTQGELIGKMKSRGIGRPSTYATTIDKLFLRRYVVEKKEYLIPTDLGRRVHGFLMSRYSEFLSEERTRFLEEKMMKVERGERDYFELLRELYEEMRNIDARGKNFS